MGATGYAANLSRSLQRFRSREKRMSGGCSRKLDRRALLDLLDKAARGLGTDEPLSPLRLLDAAEVPLAPHADSVVASVDLLYVFGNDLHRFGAIAVLHAFSDIYASLSGPRFAMLTLGVSMRDLGVDGGASLIEGVASTIRREGAMLAGGHTVMADETFASISVVGDAPEVEASGRPKVGDILLLSKPLGSGLALTALRLGAATDEKLTSAYEVMLSSNRSPADVVIATLKGDPGCVSGITDVSGFGLLDAINQIATGCEIHLDMAAVPTLSGTEEWLRQQATSSLTDANVVMTDEFTSYVLSGGLGRSKAVLNDPQTSGGLVLVASAACAGVLESSGQFLPIGRIDATDVDSRIIVV